MISTNDIMHAVATVLNGLGCEVHGENVIDLDTDGSETVQLSVELVSSYLLCGGIEEFRSYLIDIMWANAIEPTNEDMNAAQDKIARAIQPFIPISDRKLKPDNVRYNKTDGLAHVIFELNFYDLIIERDSQPNAEKIIIGGI